MDLYDVVNLEVPTSVKVTLRPRGENERPILEATQGRLVDLVLAGADDGSSSAAAPIQQVPPQQEPVVEEPLVEEEQVAPQVIPIDVEESVEEEEDPSKLKRKSARGQDEGESSKKVRHEAEVEHPEASVEKP